MINLHGENSHLNQDHLEMLQRGSRSWNAWRSKYPGEKIDLSGAYLRDNSFSHYNLSNIDFIDCNLSGCYFFESNLSGCNFNEAHMINSHFPNGNLRNISFKFAELTFSSFYNCNLENAYLYGAELEHCLFSKSNINGAILSHSSIYGVAVWDLVGTPKESIGMIISEEEENTVTVDNLEVAQFLYSILSNKRIKFLIDEITCKSVLILGRFSDKRKVALDYIREELKKIDLIPIIFDFDKPKNQTILETILTLSGLSKLIIADITDARMVREEIRSIAEKYPSKPIQPILEESNEEFSSLVEMRTSYRNILCTIKYSSLKELGKFVSSKVLINPAIDWLGNRGRASYIEQLTKEETIVDEIEKLTKRLNTIKRNEST